ncbi:hypothetical protein RirG_024890 [Rhizophagus irregularis DAOM 197198w]|uniref:HAT C-terminal dimerisation domain-containing protein n=1 Tax=Rhizophagus irregularis (strain DAOM 197198w) TaxID=1432141 RepID=A0A015NDJ5_RHIIW|nr:hypothetical protein RirG_024890 [Rhizophagus irregularis DAOM 197198w]
MVITLEPFETITRKISGAKYSTLSLVVPYIYILKNNFAPNEENETLEMYLNLVYGSNGEEEDSEMVSDDEYIPSENIRKRSCFGTFSGRSILDKFWTNSGVSRKCLEFVRPESVPKRDRFRMGGTRQHWQYSHRQFHYQRRGNTQNRGRGRGRGRRRGGASTSHPVEPNLDDINIVEYLQPVNTEGLLQKVRAAIYLSLDELWPVPSNIMLVATFLDPRFKNFDWCNGNDKDEAKELVQVLYNDAKKDISPRDSINSIITSSSDDDDDIFKALKGKETNVRDDDEVVLYLQQKQIRLKDDPLKWWSVNEVILPVLAQIARKYLSIPAASVPSERLFSDAGNHISARRTRLSPDLVDKMLFLKRNSDIFDIFPPLD